MALIFRSLAVASVVAAVYLLVALWGDNLGLNSELVRGEAGQCLAAWLGAFSARLTAALT